jgi:hypothetical protein
VFVCVIDFAARVAAARVAEREQAEGHLLGYAEVADFVRKACPQPRE